MEAKLAKVIGVMKRTDGRDKSFRIVQYVSMLSVCALPKGGHAGAIAGSMKTAMSTTRKSLRLVRMLENLKELVRVYFQSNKLSGKKLNIILHVLAVSAEVVYYFYDHLVWLHRIQVRALPKLDAVRTELMSSYAWLSNASFEFLRVLSVLISLLKERSRLRKLPPKIDEREKREVFELHRENNAMIRKQIVNVVKQGSDVITATCEANLLSFALTERQNRTIEGISGLLASIIGWYGVMLDVKI